MTEVKKPVRRRRAAPAGIAPNEPERDILDQYLYEVSTYPLLKGTEEIELAKKIRSGDQDALQELVKRNPAAEVEARAEPRRAEHPHRPVGRRRAVARRTQHE